MPETATKKLINKTNTGFPDYLDFDRLRREGIDYLGKLSGKIWTDHNVHDPGITILEMLCYAMIDLGYRNNLPVGDIFTKNPAEGTSEDNFFTPAQILTNNPLTIIDFRKLLIDIPGVKNAWLEIARDFDAEEFCRVDGGVEFSENQRDICCDRFINGLYHVYIDLEKNVINEIPEVADRETEKIRKLVRDKLLAHRNFCEDFLDITVLCKLELGVCADIELDIDANSEEVFLQVAEKLYRFFSPAPVFYTLPQLLEKGKNIEEIFAGRPLDVKQSHGFVDTEEFEKLKLRKEIHLSDIYNTLLQIKGVKRVQHLQLRRCDQQQLMQSDRWKFILPENHVPEFSIECSGFRFFRNSIPINFDFDQYKSQIIINASQNGKILYDKATPYLDVEIPKAVYRKDIDQYYSIQNEFPRVYGIAEGGLADNVSSERKAKALQLKGYLLFFDQLLANFLSQLKNIRSLFSFSGPSNAEGYTYFINEDLSSVPEIEKLLRFSYTGSNNSLGLEGTTLARPVSKVQILQLINDASITKLDIASVQAYKFGTLDEATIAIHQLGDDFATGSFQVEIVEKDNECVFFYLISSSDCFLLLSNIYYKSVAEARRAAETVSYIGNFRENFEVFLDSFRNSASFNIDFNLSGYAKYLQLISENKNLFLQRRNSFLEHLLARFAEQFTDFALLSYGNFSPAELTAREIKAKENYLMNYPVLSADRGKGYDYRRNGWNNDNTSGFEGRFKALTGISNPKRNSLCNFEVAQYESRFIFDISIAGKHFFKSPETYSSKEEAKTAISALLNALKFEQAYKSVFDKEQQQFRLFVGKFPFSTLFKSEEEAKRSSSSLLAMFAGGFSAENVFVNSYKFSARILNNKEEIVRIFHESADSEDSAIAVALKAISKINDEGVWTNPEVQVIRFGRLLTGKLQEENILIDASAFKMNIDNTIVGKPDKYTYELLDNKNSFKLRSEIEFNDEKSARADGEKLLLLLANQSNYNIQRKEVSGKYVIRIGDGQNNIASFVNEFESELSAQSYLSLVQTIIDNAKYSLVVQKFPDTWRFRSTVGYDQVGQFSFFSTAVFKSKKEAEEAGLDLRNYSHPLELKKDGKNLTLVRRAKKKEETLLELEGTVAIDSDMENKVREALELQTKSIELVKRPESSQLESFISTDRESQQGLFVYRLVDKDKQYAKYLPFGDTQSEAELLLQKALAKGSSSINYMDIVLKGNVTITRKNQSDKREWYHFQIRTAKAVVKPGTPSVAKTLVLLESSKGYTTEEMAISAFQDQYMELLELGVNKDSYLVSKKIHAGEYFIHNEDICSPTETLAFVPRETLDYLGAYEEKAIDELILLLNLYPIKRIFPKRDCKVFHNRFKACEESTCETKDTDSCDCKYDEKPLYYYTLFNPETSQEEWQSVGVFDSIEEARRDFQFLLILLKYPGNYYVDCACDSTWNDKINQFESRSVFQIFVREVLAESAKRFRTEEEAWGRQGVQRFIDTAQSQKSFHNYVRATDCCYSYYVACNSVRLYHPCRYNTPEQRDKVASLLFKESSLLNKWQFNEYCARQGNNGIINDFEGSPVAIVHYEGSVQDSGTNYFEWYANILNRISERGLCITGNKLYLYGKSISFAPVNSGDTDLEKLKANLKWLAAYFPFIQKSAMKNGQREINYCIEIKLPGFNDDGTDDCHSTNEKGEMCYVAWEADCCYEDCNSAVAAFQTALQLVADFRNYRLVYDCTCSSYGIELHYKNTLTDNANNECGYIDDKGNRIILPCENEIVAYNPQCYNDAATACDAVSRSLELVNEEGLHVVEHILLRPHCKDDCDCRLIPCENEFGNCKFPYYQKPEEDPCNSEKAICFTPGYDPYSFIATIVLPAWPQRFRDPEKRQMFEQVLYREAPAHVMIRILWLAPHDFCCFEKEYKKWIKWLGKKPQCIPFDRCALRDFLFHRQFECLDKANACLPCTNNNTLQNPCITERTLINSTSITENLTRKMNEVFCWQQQDCNQYRFISCDQRRTKDEVILLRQALGSATATSGNNTVSEGNGTNVGKVLSDVSNDVDDTKDVIPSVNSIGKAKFINGRLSKYKKELDALVNSTKGLKLVVRARRFVDNPTPLAVDFNKLVQEVVEEHSGKKNKLLTKARMIQLLEMLTWYYLDKWAFNGKDIGTLAKTEEAFIYMKQNKINMLEIYRLWESENLRKFEPLVDFNAVRQILTGNK